MVRSFYDGLNSKLVTILFTNAEYLRATGLQVTLPSWASRFEVFDMIVFYGTSKEEICLSNPIEGLPESYYRLYKPKTISDRYEKFYPETIDTTLFVGLPTRLRSSLHDTSGVAFTMTDIEEYLIYALFNLNLFAYSDGFFGRQSFSLSSYTTENNNYANDTAKNFTIGFELELDKRTPFEALLSRIGFMATSDSTCAVEYKSPIYDTESEELQEVFKLIDDHIDPDTIQSAHIHIGHNNYVFRTITRQVIHHHSNARSLTSKIMSKPIEKIYGRNPNRFCAKSSVITSRNAIYAQQRKGLLEFRMARYRNAEQYNKAIELSKLITTSYFLQGLKQYRPSIKPTRYFEEVWNKDFSELNYI